MKATLVGRERRVCRLEPGEVRRLPFEGALVGFYVACPGCGFRNFTLVTGQHVVDSKDALTLAPGFWCDGPRCERHLHVKDGELVVTE